MALSAKLAMRQGQSMVLTPQLLQAIKLLQMPNAELAAFIEAELERNPLLERADDRPAEPGAFDFSETPPAPETDAVAGDWARETFETDPAALAQSLGTEIENAFDPDRAVLRPNGRLSTKGSAPPRRSGPAPVDEAPENSHPTSLLTSPLRRHWASI